MRILLHPRHSVPNEDIPPSWVSPPRKSQLTALQLPSEWGSGLQSTTLSMADRHPPSAQTMGALWRKVKATQKEAQIWNLGPGLPESQRRNQRSLPFPDSLPIPPAHTQVDGPVQTQALSVIPQGLGTVRRTQRCGCVAPAGHIHLQLCIENISLSGASRYLQQPSALQGLALWSLGSFLLTHSP